ncbi:MAG TPA: elongation factor P [Pyrinomonadaceae bacterium]|nr:elongation factor P [Pyrinomonadaceae bacterium]
MPLVSANELKRKLLITVEGQPYVVVDVFFASPTARGAATMVRTRLRQLLTGAVMEKSFRSSEKFEEPDIELAPASFLYSDGHGFHFMDEKSYEQFTFDEAAIDSDRGYLKEGISLQVLKYNGAPVSLQLPQYVELRVTETELGLRGDTAAGGATKMATLETGISVRVPLFIKEGESVRVNTQTGEVAGRA